MLQVTHDTRKGKVEVANKMTLMKEWEKFVGALYFFLRCFKFAESNEPDVWSNFKSNFSSSSIFNFGKDLLWKIPIISN